MPAPGGGDAAAPRRAYDQTLRRQQADATRERIVRAGSELLHGASVRDWRRVTVRAVAAAAGVNERTVYRHFGSERGLRDAVMHRLEEEAGIDLSGLTLGGVAAAAAQIFEHLSSYPGEPRPPLDPTLVDAGRRQRAALLGAVGAAAADWTADQQALAAAVLDVLWSMETYERLAVDWQLDTARAVAGATWVIGLVGRAVAEGRGPG